jgi:hypothetical protein
MQSGFRLRLTLGAIRAASGPAFWALMEIMDAGVLSDHLVLTLAAFVSAGLGSHMAMSGPLTQKQAGARALLLGAIISLLTAIAALRYDEVSHIQPFTIAFLVVLGHLCLPFLITQGQGRGLRHYPSLYAEAWKLFARLLAAWVFAGLTWAVIYLSDLVLGLVGLHIMDLIAQIEPLSMMITGAAIGLGLAVMLETGGAVVPALLQRLLRLLLLILLAVVVPFLVILPFRGFDNVFGDLSARGIFLTLVALMATMVTAATSPDEGQEVALRSMSVATRVTAALMILLAVLALCALASCRPIRLDTGTFCRRAAYSGRSDQRLSLPTGGSSLVMARGHPAR